MLLPLAFFDFFGFQGILILAILGVLLYGERLPEVAASLGKQFMQLKKSVQGIRNEIESVAFDAKHSVTQQYGARPTMQPTRRPRPPSSSRRRPSLPPADRLRKPHGSLGNPPADNS